MSNSFSIKAINIFINNQYINSFSTKFKDNLGVDPKIVFNF